MSDPRRLNRLPDFFSRQVNVARRFYLDLSPPSSTGLTVVCGGYEQCTAEYEIHRKTFPYYSIEFVASGKGHLTLGKKEADLVAGTVFSYGPDTAHHIVTDRTASLGKYFVDFAGTNSPKALQECGLHSGSIARVHSPGDIERVFDDLIRDGAKAGGTSQVLCNALLNYLLPKLASCITPHNARLTTAFTTYDRCRQYIEQEYPRVSNLAQISEECGVDKAYLCHLFQRYDRQTPYQLLIRLKMNLAAECLLDSSKLIKDTAKELGFADVFHFSRLFKKTFGVSPQEFRRLQ